MHLLKGQSLSSKMSPTTSYFSLSYEIAVPSKNTLLLFTCNYYNDELAITVAKHFLYLLCMLDLNPRAQNCQKKKGNHITLLLMSSSLHRGED